METRKIKWHGRILEKFNKNVGAILKVDVEGIIRNLVDRFEKKVRRFWWKIAEILRF